MNLINPQAQTYAEKYTVQEDDILNEIELKNHIHPESHMLSGTLQGKFLEMISKLLNPAFILEIGTFLGYSALCLVKGLKPGGELHTFEIDEKSAAVARENFKKSKTENKIILHTGNALELLNKIDKPWDLVFIDADKTGYIDYYNALLPKLKSGCLIMADNVLFHGQVFEEEVKGKSAKAIQAFNDMILSDNRVEKMMLTLRDGLYLLRKK
ncbi:MAG TPA: O-methyltransferase [Puia sp.]|jgi:caffeoyl-CoA O-methyltransferase|nr:O-methyltransferase [Puia sp.]